MKLLAQPESYHIGINVLPRERYNWAASGRFDGKFVEEELGGDGQL